VTGPLGELGGLLKQAQQMQRDLDRAREQLAAITVEGSAGGGAVRVVVTGDRKVTKIEISDEALAQSDKEMLEDLILAAVRDGIEKASRLAEEALGKITGGLNLPGLS
jgi:DNA-binding YbaB/EbfC family protein